MRRPASPARLAVCLAAVTFVVFAPSLWNGFVQWDDDINLVTNEAFRGLGPTQLRWMFTTTITGHWIPVTWLTFGLDYVVWGMNPLGYHLTNVVLHAANAALFFLVALRLVGEATAFGPGARVVAALTAALLFALHPLRAESVAWVTERRDVLSGFLTLLTVLGYLGAVRADGRRRRWLLGVSVVSYALALLSKEIVMTLPLVLVVLDVYPLRRLPTRWREWTRPPAARVWAEKLPYLVLGIAGGALSYYVVSSGSLLTTFADHPWPARIGIAGYSLAFYVVKTALPLSLSPLYELPPRVDLVEPRFLVSLVGVAVVGAGLLLVRRRWPAALAAGVSYGILLGPVTGIVHSGWQLAHDRYSYLACLPWALLVGAGLGALFDGAGARAVRPAFRRAVAAAAALWLVGLAVLTAQQVQVWRDSDTLWRYAIDVDPGCALCRSNLGAFLLNEERLGQAIPLFERSLALRPERVKPRVNLGLALARLGRRAEARSHFEHVIQRHPRYVDALAALGAVLIDEGEAERALAHLDRATRLDPKHLPARTNLAGAFASLGRWPQAIEQYQLALEAKPDAPQPRLGLTRVYLAMGERDAARQQYEALSRIDPRLAAQVGPAFLARP